MDVPEADIASRKFAASQPSAIDASPRRECSPGAPDLAARPFASGADFYTFAIHGPLDASLEQ